MSRRDAVTRWHAKIHTLKSRWHNKTLQNIFTTDVTAYASVIKTDVDLQVISKITNLYLWHNQGATTAILMKEAPNADDND